MAPSTSRPELLPTGCEVLWANRSSTGADSTTFLAAIAGLVGVLQMTRDAPNSSRERNTVDAGGGSTELTAALLARVMGTTGVCPHWVEAATAAE